MDWKWDIKFRFARILFKSENNSNDYLEVYRLLEYDLIKLTENWSDLGRQPAS